MKMGYGSKKEAHIISELQTSAKMGKSAVKMTINKVHNSDNDGREAGWKEVQIL